MSKKALAGFRVIEYTDGIGASYCGKLLAAMGAEVIKVERPGTGDITRSLAPFLNGEQDIEKSCSYFYCNTDKYSVTLDIDNVEGQKIMHSLLAGADVFIRTGLPEWYDERTLDWEALHKKNPKLILASLTPYGESGPYRNYKGNPLNMSHMSAIAILNPLGSWPDFSHAPVMQGANFEQYDLGVVSAIGVLAALFKSLRGGKGEYMELSELEASYQLSNTDNTTWPVFGYSQDRLGTKLKEMASEEVKVADGYVCPYIVNDAEYDRVAEMIGRPEWVEDGWLRNHHDRMSRIDEFRDAFQGWMRDKTRAEISETAQKHRLAIGPVLTLKEAMEMEQFHYREFFTYLEHPVWGRVRILSRPFIMSETPLVPERAAPLLGEHNKKVYREILGIDDITIKRLKNDGII